MDHTILTIHAGIVIEDEAEMELHLSITTRVDDVAKRVEIDEDLDPPMDVDDECDEPMDVDVEDTTMDVDEPDMAMVVNEDVPMEVDA
ncbi:hypothetical protein FOMPIDRAFT_95283 [Fomitopsis schrenkii]|uniref:Uncharacterized protein n=1 Tax=Fomitopsis schrenkii TaxID=2126942 RepID=S8FU70_FOMSC|nr:hypothetical protein FOMPIDRAFT_1048342 [Fomitopsis schrenkii]EPT03546.1 hypothetical protein FOMPIDRAFT_95283 [Fomitopsis schrenkii]